MRVHARRCRRVARVAVGGITVVNGGVEPPRVLGQPNVAYKALGGLILGVKLSIVVPGSVIVVRCRLRSVVEGSHAKVGAAVTRRVGHDDLGAVDVDKHLALLTAHCNIRGVKFTVVVHVKSKIFPLRNSMRSQKTNQLYCLHNIIIKYKFLLNLNARNA